MDSNANTQGTKDSARRQAGYIGGSLLEIYKVWAASRGIDDPQGQQVDENLTTSEKCTDLLEHTATSNRCPPSAMGTPGCGGIRCISEMDPEAIPAHLKGVAHKFCPQTREAMIREEHAAAAHPIVDDTPTV